MAHQLAHQLLMLLRMVCKVLDGTFFSSLFSWSSFVLLFPSEMESVFLWFYPLSFYHSRKGTDNWDVEHHFWLIWWMRINLLHSQVENESFLLWRVISKPSRWHMHTVDTRSISCPYFSFCISVYQNLVWDENFWN